jgi:hypothetical protein
MTALRRESVLMSELEPVMTKSFCKLPGVWDRVRGSMMKAQGITLGELSGK